MVVPVANLEMLRVSPILDDADWTTCSALDSASVGPNKMQSSKYHSCFRDGMDESSSVILIMDRHNNNGPRGRLAELLSEDWKRSCCNTRRSRQD